MTNCSNVFVLETNENSAKIIESYLKSSDLDLDVEIFTNFQEGFEQIKNLVCREYKKAQALPEYKLFLETKFPNILS